MKAKPAPGRAATTAAVLVQNLSMGVDEGDMHSVVRLLSDALDLNPHGLISASLLAQGQIGDATGDFHFSGAISLEAFADVFDDEGPTLAIGVDGALTVLGQPSSSIGSSGCRMSFMASMTSPASTRSRLRPFAGLNACSVRSCFGNSLP